MLFQRRSGREPAITHRSPGVPPNPQPPAPQRTQLLQAGIPPQGQRQGLGARRPDLVVAEVQSLQGGVGGQCTTEGRKGVTPGTQTVPLQDEAAGRRPMSKSGQGGLTGWGGP